MASLGLGSPQLYVGPGILGQVAGLPGARAYLARVQDRPGRPWASGVGSENALRVDRTTLGAMWANLPSLTPRDWTAVDPCGSEHRPEQVELFKACFTKRVEAPEPPRAVRPRSPPGRSTTQVGRPKGGRALSSCAGNTRRVLHRGDESSAATIVDRHDAPPWRVRGIFSSLVAAASRNTAERGVLQLNPGVRARTRPVARCSRPAPARCRCWQ